MRYWIFTLMLVVTSQQGWCQYTIRGTVRDTAQSPLPGVHIAWKGTSLGTVTDAHGEFEFQSVSPGTLTLVASFIGFITQERTLTVPAALTVDLVLSGDTKQLDDVLILHATRASETTATTYVNIDAPELRKQNFGQDLPVLLNWTPSVVTTSDAGTGIGYTGIRIRGSDATRVNVTINGIPYNDSESQSTFWVDIPDIASSTKSIQIQRGVGTSTNGAGAFGASINLDTRYSVREDEDSSSFAEATLGAGSYGSRRYTLRGGYYLGPVFLEGKLSKISSDGYVERASADLGSYYFRAKFEGASPFGIQLLAFGGAEKTYQAWYGVDASTLQSNRRMNYAGAIYDTLGNINRYYANQVDDYKQDHAQLHVSYRFSRDWNLAVSFHGTYGRGFYEEYQQDRTFASVGLPDFSGVTSTDMIVRKWLDNYFYGLTFGLSYYGERSAVVIGGAASSYDPAKHFGEIVWAEEPNTIVPGYRYYSGLSGKGDRNLYVKWNYQWSPRFSSFVDLQYRGVNYSTAGTQDDQSAYAIDDRFDFINPKAGLTYFIGKGDEAYVSYSIANREPNRSDYLEGATKPRAERLHNIELGWRKKSSTWSLDLNYFLMQYTDQLVQTGALDGAGYPVRANVGKSYRTGLEATALFKLSRTWSWNVNGTWSVNRNKEVAQSGVPMMQDTRIILSPDWIAGSQLAWSPIEGLEAAWLSKFVGKQYLDNTESEAVSLPAYWINDLRLTYEMSLKGVKRIRFSVLASNVFDVMYSSNGYSYGGTPYFYPQAGRNLMAMMTVRL